MKKIAFFILTFALISSCTQTIYKNLDEIILYYSDDYVTLDDEQEALFEATLEAFIEEQKTTSLPLVYEKLTETQALILEPLNLELIEEKRLELIELRLQFAYDLIDRFAPLVVQLRDEQIDEIHARIIEQSDEYKEKRLERRENKTEKERIEDALDNRIDDFEAWFDYITVNQTAYLKEYLLTNQWSFDIVYANRIRYAAILFSYLKTQKDAEALKKQLKIWIKEPSLMTTEEYEVYRKRRLIAMQDYLLRMTQMLEDDQKAYFIEELENYKETIKDIMNDTKG